MRMYWYQQQTTIFFLYALVSSRQVESLSVRGKTETVKNEYYSYKRFKKLGLPAVAYSTVARLACRALRCKPRELVSPPNSDVRNEKKVAIVTGSNTGVGFETAKALVQDHGMEVILACRSMEKGQKACKAINKFNGTGKAVCLQPLDLSDLDSVRGFAQTIQSNYDRIDVLINNAGRNSAGESGPMAPAPDDEGTLDSIFTPNFLGHFLLTNLLLNKCCDRIVNLSSVMHHFPTYDDSTDSSIIEKESFWHSMAVEPQPVPTSNDDEVEVRKPYGPSKLAALLFSLELNRRYGKSKGIRSIAVNPGSVSSDIWRNYPPLMRKLYQLLYLSPKQGSATSVAAAIASDIDQATVYLQPYRMPFFVNEEGPPFPLFEMLGPFAGWVETKPRLLKEEKATMRACRSMFAVCEKLTACRFG